MKFKTLTLFAALASISLAASAAPLTRSETTHHTLHFAATGPRVLDVRTIHGSIAVEAYDGDTVEITVRRHLTADNAAAFENAQRDVRLQIDDNAATLGAIARYADGETCGERNIRDKRERPHYEVFFDFEIRVPRDTRLDLCTIDRGDISVKGLRADFHIDTVNGRIDLADMAGSGEATTVNGSLIASFAAAPRKDSVFRTINGSVVLTMPAALSADLDMKTLTGGLFTDFDAAPRATLLATAPQRRDGKFVFETNSFATVRIGRGGPRFTLETLNGDVRVLRGAR